MSIQLPSFNETTYQQHEWHGLPDANMAIAIANLQAQKQCPFLIVTQDAQQAQQLASELRFFTQKNTVIFPDWETLPYDRFSAHQDIISARLIALYLQTQQSPAFLIAQMSSLLHFLVPEEHLNKFSLVLKVGQRLDRDQFVERLDQAGYQRVSQVMEHGDYAIRGGILDLFPMGGLEAIRVDWLDDEVDTLRVFDTQSQMSLKQLSEITILPAKEYPLNEANIHHFRQAWRDIFPDVNHTKNVLFQSVSKGKQAAGLEYYLPLFYEKMSSIFDYLADNTTLILVDELHQAAEKFWIDVNERWQLARLSTDYPALPPEKLFITTDVFFAQMKRYQRYQLLSASSNPEKVFWHSEQIPSIQIDASRRDSLWRLKDWLTQLANQKVLLAAESLGRREVLIEMLSKSQIQVMRAEGWDDFQAQQEPGLYLTVANIERPCLLSHHLLITEQQLLGEQVKQKRRRKQHSQHAEFMDGIRSLAELEIGDPIVHLEHGVGRFLGLEVLTVNGLMREFVTLSYADEDKLYVPVTDLQQISRYAGGDPEHAPLHKLGTDRWQKVRKQALEKVRDVAAELLDLYAKRAARHGHAFNYFEEDYLRFSSQFAFETTDDQQSAIDAVLKDMQSSRPMDRLVCGDVGFGKTEVAMRAAFMSVHNNKQVAVLVPTTLLANQHLQNFRDRFASWPVRIEALSRFGSGKSQKEIIADIHEGKVDIVIGTHKLLQEDVKFKDLGLIIIDEEHRFGVKQKEILKQVRSEVDILAMTATPIPRTLSMAFADLRDMSIIATPPAKRQSIQTFVQTWNTDLVKEACNRELRRGGQIYCLFNDVDKMPLFTDELQTLLPDAKIAMAHGQMPEKELEQVMRQFYHRQFQILVCTTIIETGIDIPNANTILIIRADKFGLAQLHQLRGRVGRSHHKAYAYLFTAPEESLSTDAKKRLEAIARHDQLGAGFALATQDLEIRGAGELLGHEQSGAMHEIGFELYSQLLDKAVRAYKRGEIPDLSELEHAGCEIDIAIPAYIPEDYLPDINARLVIYKRLSACDSEDEVHQLQVEMIDRFGLLPIAVQQLVALHQIKLQAYPLGIVKIEGNAKFLRLHFNDKPHIDPMMIIKLIQQQPKSYQLEGANKLKYTAELTDSQNRLVALSTLIKTLSAAE